MNFPYFGETCALLTAVIWAFAVILFRRSGETAHPIALNLFKNVLALLLLLLTGWLLGQAFMQKVSSRDFLLLLLSGALGIGISDTLFFKCLNLLGAGLTAIVDCFYSPFIIIMSWFWLNERLSWIQLVGVLLIISAVLVATFEKNQKVISRRDLIWGIVYGFLAMFTVAMGIVMIKPFLDTDPPLVWVMQVRMAAGVQILLIFLLFRPDRRRILGSLKASRGWKYIIPGSILGAYFSLILWMAGMKYTQASVASALNQTSTIFTFLFAGLFLREVINLQRVIGIIVAVTGAVLVTLG